MENKQLENMEAMHKIIASEIFEQFHQPMKVLLAQMQQRSGRIIKTEFKFKSIMMEDVKFLINTPVGTGSYGKGYYF